jgi:hypothetical protein
MAYSVFNVTQLPARPLDAAATFHGDIAHSIRQDLKNADEQLDRVILFAPAGHEHAGWRIAAVQELAREAAPARVNAIVGEAADAIEQVMDYLDSAPGVTGQVLQVHGNLAQEH